MAATTAIIPHKNDVLFGRGAPINNHPGNQRYRLSVEAHKSAFVTAKRRKDKRSLAHDIMQQIQNLHPPGRFLIEDDRGIDNRDRINNCSKNDNDGIHPAILKRVWVEVSNDKAMVKIMHRLRGKDKNKSGDTRNNNNKITSNGINNLKRDEEEETKEVAMKSNGLVDYDKGTNANVEQLVGEYSLPMPMGDTEEEGVAGQYDDLFNDTDVAGERHQEQLPNEVGQFDGLFDTAEENVAGQFDDVFDIAYEGNNAATLEQECVETSLGLNIYYKSNEQHQWREFTLKQWVGRCKSKLMTCDTNQMLGYTKAALPMVLKLVDYLIEAEDDEKNGQRNPVPLGSIRAENVLIQSKQPAVIRGEDEVIEHVWIMSLIGDDPDVGTVVARLCAVGNVLYELFAGEEYKLTLEDGMQNHDGDGSAVTLECIDVDGEDDNRPRKRAPYSEDKYSNCLARLASKGFPSSVRALVRNLLDCEESDHCDDDAYTSFHDLRTDLRFMLDDPSRFLVDIQVNNGLPTLEICDKLYGRESEEEKLNQLYQHHINTKELKGVIISGGAGVGKSRLAMHIQKLTSKANGYFYTAKFQQNNMHVKPLSTIGALFNSLCDRFAEDASPLQLRSVSNELVNALGSQAGLLAGVVPSLLKLMPYSISLEETSIACVDAPSSMRYLFGELLRVVSYHSNRHISLLIDDIQFADSASLLLISDLLFSAAISDLSVFFAFCHRDNCQDGMFNIWLSSISMYGLEELKLNNMNVEGVNSLISDSLHLSPRITHPLSAVLHHKTMGNPLFVRQLLASLTGQGYIYVDLSQPRWTWDLKKIADQEISESVLVLLVEEMKRLPSDLQLGLKVASCLGSCVQKNVLDILSKDVGVDLIDVLKQVSEKGLMGIEDDGMMFSFAHDKIQQAAYELMSPQEQRKNHMQYGMSICSYTLDNCPDNNELFFPAITQINHGGPSVISDPNQSTILAKLNLKAGKLSIVLSDYATALSLFEHGISYLGDDKWTLEYDISLDIFDSAAEAACVLNKNAAVTSYTKELVANAKSFDDSLNCLAVAAKCLHHVGLIEQSMKSTLDTLAKLGERPLLDIDDNTLQSDMMEMNEILRNTPDESILNLQENKAKKINTTLKIYSNLCHILHLAKPSLIGSASLRMVELTMDHGLVSSSPIAFGFYGGVLVINGSVKEGCRLGRLALKLVENKLSLVHKSAVIASVYNLVLWASDPLQSIIEAHEIGRKVGQQSGDFLYSAANWHMSITTGYFAGVSLDKVQTNVRDYIMTMQHRNSRVFVGGSILLYHHARVLKDGLCALDAKPSNIIPTEEEALQQFSHSLFLTNIMIHQLVRAYHFRRLDDLESHDIVDISGDIERNKHYLRGFLLFGIFFEGLASFLLARQTTRDSERSRWIEKGEKVLTKIRYCSEHSSWNWENKMVLLEAEKMHTMGNFDQAALLYERAIRLAHEHKFINDEAIASELAGTFFCERGLDDTKAEALLLHSAQCYKTWGALAVTKRVQTYIASKFGAESVQRKPNIIVLASILVSHDDSSKKRQST